jgi:hypothetical protein
VGTDSAHPTSAGACTHPDFGLTVRDVRGTTDIAVIGAGVIGLTIALELA